MSNRNPFFLDPEDRDDILKFLAASRPMDGAVWDGDDRLAYGKFLIQAYAEGCCENIGPQPLKQEAYKCACMVYFLHSVEPLEGYSFCDGGNVAAGYMQVQTHIEERLLRALGHFDDPPHKTHCEKVAAYRGEQQRAAGEPWPAAGDKEVAHE